MVFKISMNPGNFMTQIISAPDLSRAQEIAQEMEERYTEVEPYLGSEVRFFMPLAYANGFVERYLEADFGFEHGVFNKCPSLYRKANEDWRGFAYFEAYHVDPDNLETLMDIAPREAVFLPWENEG